jgi:hypothetical protein
MRTRRYTRIILFFASILNFDYFIVSYAYILKLEEKYF